ncbi:site-specific integrase [Chromobacterium haemolyticum]|uniref:site-specific integrase n=1 Tax=Chromobacterium haemolyticum TaxID=394935 RepID=UPI0009D9C751|nr:site-specific integrase [Chromobacterium haemolyticum]OQS31721.1 hypothetical protein B0T39_23835 [Chromobacterium haemolyticum]
MQFVPTQKSPLRDILNFYVESISIQKRGYKAEVYRIKALAEHLGELTLSEITPIQVAAYRDKRLATPNPRTPEKTLATSTVKLELMLLSHVFSTAATEWGMDWLSNPVLKIRKPKASPGRSRRMTPTEERMVLRAAYRYSNPEFYAIVVLALETAMRQGEILSLRWENINWTKRTALLPFTKNNDIREVPLSRKAYDIFDRFLVKKPDGRIFRYTSSGIKSSWRNFIQNLGIEDLHFHDLRGCCISSLLERGLNTIEVATISGHRSMAMLKRYSHLYSHLLVPKLDPKPRAKKNRPVLREQIPSYPAVITTMSQDVCIDFPDFLDLRFSGRDENRIIGQARDHLLRKIIGMLCDGAMPPIPSNIESVTENIKNGRVELISPL